MKKILLVTYHGGMGGVAMQLLYLLEEFRKYKNFKFEVCFASSEGPIAEEIKKFGINTYCFGIRNGLDFINGAKLLNFLKSNSFDLIHLHYFTPLLRVLAMLSNVPVLMTDHGSVRSLKERKISPMKYIHRLMRKCPVFYTADSKDGAQQMISHYKISASQVKVIYNGIRTEDFNPNDYLSSTYTIRDEFGIPKETLVIGTVRGLTSKMGIDHLIKAMGIILKKNLYLRQKLFCLIVGDGPLRKNLEDLAKSIGICGRIIFAGQRRDIPELLSAMDIFVLPSIWEGLPVSGIEAMAMARPVIGYKVGGIPELIIHKKTGLLVEERNPVLLAQGIEYLIKDDNQRKMMGKKAQETIKTYFNVAKAAQEYLSLYNSLLHTFR